MKITVITKMRKISYKVAASSIKTKIEENRLRSKNLQMAAIEHITPSLSRRAPEIVGAADFRVVFKGIDS